MILKRRSIFMIGDFQEVEDLIKTHDQTERLLVEFAPSGQEALERLRTKSELPAVILLDLLMPGITGFQFREAQEKDPRLATIPILVIIDGLDAEVNALKIGAKGYIRKPIKLADLFKIADQYCS